MKTIILALALFPFGNCNELEVPRKRRGSFQTTYPAGANKLQIGGVNIDTFIGEPTLYSPGIGHLPIHQRNQPDVSLKANGGSNIQQQLYEIPQTNFIESNAIDKPVQESQEYVPPQSVGTAIIPPRPPPATPVNAVGSNIPGNGGAVFLGAGALGVIDLGGGAYALGAGSLGYSEMRSNPRSSFKAPLLPPVRAAPNLLPAAIPSPQPQVASGIRFSDLYLDGTQSSRDQNGYEYLRPDRVGFGAPLPPRPLKTTMAFATPSNIQIQQALSYQPVAPTGFGQTDPGLFAGGYYK